ncbi:sensor histidine kinase [Paenibacillus sp. NPDC058071]|uniref:cache domain-containing sensor histidine kinase n=1 Tax=Paenibacillus sp. NPDC058071 TaxID=3346326 RepID=UPI0036DC5A76
MRRSLSRQIFVYFFIVILLSLSMVGVFSYVESSRAIDDQVEKYLTTVINNAAMQTDNQLATFERVSNSILSQQQVKKFLEMDPTDSYEYYQYTSRIRKDVFEKVFITYPTQIHMIYILGDHGRSIFDQNQSFSQLSLDPSQRLAELNEKTPDNGGVAILKTSLLGRDQNKVITLARKIRGYSSYTPKGVLAIEFNEQQLSQLWSQVELGEKGFFFILDNQGEVIYAPENDTMKALLQSDVPDRLAEGGDQRFTQQLNGEKTMIISRKSDYSGWSLAISMPFEELRAPISNIRSTTITVGLVTLIFALFLAIRFGKSIVGPIRILKNGMRDTEKGNWMRIETAPREDEIGGLIHSYNLMVSRLSEMIEQVYNTELHNQKTQLELRDIQLERQKAEFQALQLQINPHFLYNTLETINCYAIVQDSDEISEMVEAMAFMLRYSVQTNLEEITIANELNHVRNYMIILKHRIGRDFEIDVAVPPSLLLAKTVRLTLQPLVENIFQHAFPNGMEDRHSIRIDAMESGDELLVIVEDNGVGMKADKLEELRRRLRENRLADSGKALKRKGGIGVANVHRRIQMVFGEEYGLRVESEPMRGTKMIMTMPKQHSSGSPQEAPRKEH